jgi:aryl-alcohol dehydrogenase-like predicted oxidoreductase
VLRAVAAGHDATPAQVALAWLLARPGVSSILIGASKVAQLEDNLGAADLRLTADELARLDEASAPTKPYPHWFTPMVADRRAHEALGIALSSPPIR